MFLLRNARETVCVELSNRFLQERYIQYLALVDCSLWKTVKLEYLEPINIAKYAIFCDPSFLLGELVNYLPIYLEHYQDTK